MGTTVIARFQVKPDQVEAIAAIEADLIRNEETSAKVRSAWDALIRSRALVLDEMAERHHAVAEAHRLSRIAQAFTSASQRLNENGEIIFSNNKRGFKLDIDAVKALGFYVKDISQASIPEDFKRNSKIHQCWILTKHNQ